MEGVTAENKYPEVEKEIKIESEIYKKEKREIKKT